MENHELFEKQYREIFDTWPECVKFNGECYELIPIAEKSGQDIFNHMKHIVNASWIMWNAKLEGSVVLPVKINDRPMWCKLLNTHDNDLDVRYAAMLEAARGGK